MSVTSGRTSPTPFAYFDLLSLSLRTSQGTFPWDSMPSSLTLPASGSMRSGECFERPTLVPATVGPDCSSLLSTPQARDYKGRPSDGFNQANLCRDVALLPTPTSEKAGNDTGLRCSGDGREKPNKLGWAVALLPTPTARDWKDGAPCAAVPENALLGRTVWSIGASTPTPSNATPVSSDDPPLDLWTIVDD